MQKRIALLVSLIFTCATFAAAQGEKAPLSPPASATCQLSDGKTIKTDYSSPRLRGRKMIGDHEPYGKVWRFGANNATTFVTGADVIVGSQAVPAGSYTLFALLNPDKWTLIVNKKTGEWGIPYKYEADELARVDMKLSTLPSSVENFTISYEPSDGGCILHADWDTTRASIEIHAAH